MKSPKTLLTFIAFTFLPCSCDSDANSDSHLGSAYRPLKETKKIRIYEGLPHQLWEKELLAKEKLRADITDFGDFPFYTPGISPKKETLEALRNLLISSSTVKPYTGPKRCGGFHPDFAAVWNDREHDYVALICFGCHEIKFLLPDKVLHFDINNKAYNDLKMLLGNFKNKLPEKPVAK